MNKWNYPNGEQNEKPKTPGVSFFVLFGFNDSLVKVEGNSNTRANKDYNK